MCLALRCIHSSRRLEGFWQHRLNAKAARNDCLPLAAYPAGTTDDYILVNPFTSYRRNIFGRTWTPQLNVNNVFDLRSDQGNNWTWQRYSDPRQYISSLSVDW